MFYWVRSIVVAREQFHISDFYNNFWRSQMDLFESDDVEASGANAPYDCTNVNTTTGSAVRSSMTPSWSSATINRH